MHDGLLLNHHAISFRITFLFTAYLENAADRNYVPTSLFAHFNRIFFHNNECSPLMVDKFTNINLKSSTFALQFCTLKKKSTTKALRPWVMRQRHMYGLVPNWNKKSIEKLQKKGIWWRSNKSAHKKHGTQNDTKRKSGGKGDREEKKRERIYNRRNLYGKSELKSKKFCVCVYRYGWAHVGEDHWDWTIV